ncbi:MAG TPA: hypothetical protein VJS20_05395, partial [Gemmatimonadales bacterium]|nr:hypothetical protein [Gemmatimonadales bacterium]
MPDHATADLWLEHWQDESDAAFLYNVLASVERDPRKRDVYNRLALVEERHTQLWAKLLNDNGHRVPSGVASPTLEARIKAKMGKWFGPGFLL